KLLAAGGRDVLAWQRPIFDLDEPAAAARLISGRRPALVIHAAAWTAVDECARHPRLAMARNGRAVAMLAAAARAIGAGFVLLSTNEVFDGMRRDGRGYTETDPVRPANPYGLSKAAGEAYAAEAYAGSTTPLWIVRTAWVYGPPGNDFPTKIIDAGRSAIAVGDALDVVADEVGSPTYSADLAINLMRLLERAPEGGLFHLAAPDSASRLEVAKRVIDRCLPRLSLRPIESASYGRVSRPPKWAVLDSSTAAQIGISLRPWRIALDDYLSALC
ncbi:MAG TPA: sugar nucleotide-binding protein, partial [Candidatus Limnocylindria bacterium]|nr:sugar nucleotide-binding protein [Candidatus Limnocylindria bacterium]